MVGGFADAQVKTYLVAHDAMRLLVEEDGDGKPARVLRVIGEVDFAQMRVLRMQRVRDRVFARQVLLWGWEAPTYSSTM